MTVKKHLGVFGIDAHPTPSINSTFGDGCLKWFFGDSPASLSRYLSEASAGLIDISGAEFFGFAVVSDPGVIARLKAPTKRQFSAPAALSIALGMGAGDLNRFDGLIFVVRGVQVDGGAVPVHYDGRTFECAIFDDKGEHCFMAHEVGHVVGLDHSFDLGFTNNPNGYLYGEYGDPTDLMSAKTYGNRDSTFVMPADPGSNVAPAAPFWNMCGPGISAATLWRYLPGYPAIPPWAVQLDPAAAATPITLTAAGHFGTTMAVLPWPGFGGGWWTIEYRPARDWDRGLVLQEGDHKNAPGVVIHILRDIGTGLEDPSYPRLKRVTYEGTIPVPSAGDDDWSGGSFGVRVVHANANQVSLLVGQLPNQPRATLVLEAKPGTSSSTPAGREWLPLAGPDCTGGFYETEYTEQPVEVVVTLDTVGFEYPLFTLSVNGHALTEGTVNTSFPPGTFSIAVDALMPTGTNTAAIEHRTIQVGWGLSAGTLTLELPPGDGTWTLQVSASVREGGVTAPFATASQSIPVTTSSVELSPDAVAALERCLHKMIDKLNVVAVPPRGMPSPPGPGENPDWSTLAGLSLVQALAHLRDLERSFPKTARELRIDVAKALQLPAQQLRSIEARIPG